MSGRLSGISGPAWDRDNTSELIHSSFLADPWGPPSLIMQYEGSIPVSKIMSSLGNFNLQTLRI